jgi:hypothetical protein
LQGASCIPAIIALVGLSFITDMFLVRTAGADAVMLVPHPPGTAMGGLSRELVFYSLRALLLLVNLAGIVVVLYWALSVTKGHARIGIVVTVCSYAAYARGTLRMLVTVGAVSYGFLLHPPFAIVTNATVFLREPTTPKPLYFFAGLLDIPTVTFIVFTIAGFWKAVPGLRFQRALSVVLGSWLLYAGLSYWAKR